MRKTAITAIGVLGITIALTGGSALAGSVDTDSRHSIRVKGIISFAEKLSERECSRNAACIAYAWGPCNRVSRHKADCVIHNITGTVGDQTTQQDCHRVVRFSIKRFSTKLFYRFTGEFVCAPNQEHPGF
jgi:hypothetical protein